MSDQLLKYSARLIKTSEHTKKSFGQIVNGFRADRMCLKRQEAIYECNGV